MFAVTSGSATGPGAGGLADAGAVRTAATVGASPPPAPAPVPASPPAPNPSPAPAPAASPTPSGAAVGGAAAGGTVPAGGRRERAWLALRDRLPVWVQLRCGLEPKTLAALAVVLVVAAVLAAQHFWSGRPQPVSAPETVREEVAATGSAREPEPSPGAPPPAAAASSAKRVVIDVSGEVRSPGVHRLPAGSRVTDALRAAGGVEPGADLTGLNRARVLVDGEQVVVGGPAPPGQAAPGGGAAGPGTGGADPGGAPVSLSTATVEQLDTLPGVGPVLAQHIIDYRTRHGGYRSVDELREVNGIGERRFADIEPRVRP